MFNVPILYAGVFVNIAPKVLMVNHHFGNCNCHSHDGSMYAAIYGVPWIPSIYPSHVSIYTSTMDPMGF